MHARKYYTVQQGVQSTTLRGDLIIVRYGHMQLESAILVVEHALRGHAARSTAARYAHLWSRCTYAYIISCTPYWVAPGASLNY